MQCVERVCLTCFCPGADAASSPHGKDTLQSMVVLEIVRLLTKMGRVYIYSKQRISKGMFDSDDDEFRALCQAFYEAGGQGHGALSEETYSP